MILAEAFWKYVKTQDHGCWEWQASLGNHGYGQLTFRQQKFTAHRVSWELHFGSIPDGLCVLHRCDNRKCCNPNHLFLGTRKENLQDMTDKGRRVRGSSHGRAKLTEEQVLFIRASPESARTLAQDFKVSTGTVYLIRNRKKWAHV